MVESAGKTGFQVGLYKGSNYGVWDTRCHDMYDREIMAKIPVSHGVSETRCQEEDLLNYQKAWKILPVSLENEKIWSIW